MRIYISADIEGIQGVAAADSLFPGRFDYEDAREMMTRAVLAACETAHELGAEEVVVSDSHGNGQNIRYERMPSYVQLVRSWPRPLGMMQGIEVGEYAGAFFIGYHTGATNPRGIMAHTMTGDFHEVRLNGLTVSEAALSAAIAGHFGVPVLMVAGDDAAVEETCELLGDVATATLKTSFARYSAMMLSPEVADARIRKGVRDAFDRIGRRAPYVVEAPTTLELRLHRSYMAEWLSYIDEVERLDAFTIRYKAKDIVSVSRFLTFLTNTRSVFA
ncbi:MAG: M55 family metallopeptidase [Caulobacteraceae bacterium]